LEQEVGLLCGNGMQGVAKARATQSCFVVRKYRMLNVIDELTHECLAIRINRKLKAIDVIDVLSDLL
jgi:hypothetical protein